MLEWTRLKPRPFFACRARLQMIDWRRFLGNFDPLDFDGRRDGSIHSVPTGHRSLVCSPPLRMGFDKKRHHRGLCLRLL